jgi:hypothetical protein
MANRVSRTAEVRPAAAKRAALDGKAVRNACQCGSRTPCQLVIVCAIEARGALAECAAPGRKRDRGSAGFAVPRGGCIITADALHCHAFAAAVLARGGDCVLAMKAYRGPYPDASCSRLGAPASAAAPSRSNRPATIGREVRRATVLRNTPWPRSATSRGVCRRPRPPSVCVMRRCP